MTKEKRSDDMGSLEKVGKARNRERDKERERE